MCYFCMMAEEFHRFSILSLSGIQIFTLAGKPMKVRDEFLNMDGQGCPSFGQKCIIGFHKAVLKLFLSNTIITLSISSLITAFYKGK